MQPTSVAVIVNVCYFQPLARLGASVTGVDASAENIQMAKWHAATDPVVARNVRYRACTVESLVEQEAESYDAVVASEIIEHVADAKLFVSACCKLLRVSQAQCIPTSAIVFITKVEVITARRLHLRHDHQQDSVVLLPCCGRSRASHALGEAGHPRLEQVHRAQPPGSTAGRK